MKLFYYGKQPLASADDSGRPVQPRGDNFFLRRHLYRHPSVSPSFVILVILERHHERHYYAIK